MFGICEDGDEGGDEEDYTCAYEQNANFENESSGGSVASESISESSTEIDPITRSVSTDWKCFNGLGGWKLTSHETGIIKYVPFGSGNRWEWESISHHSITKEGSTLPGVSVSFTQGVGTPHIASHIASMKLKFNVTYNFVCECPSMPLNWVVQPVDKSYETPSPFWIAKP
ncbi:MAG: hypothetical protein JWP69_1984 [Flaviaesturariibacter sp.]|nr:hypothetical protein [Flaviaesturariibacter sp.]